MDLVAWGNTYNPSLLVLRQKGYQLRAETASDGKNVLWTALKDEDSFSAHSPPELLGIVVLWETFGADWNQQAPNLLAELLNSTNDD